MTDDKGETYQPFITDQIIEGPIGSEMEGRGISYTYSKWSDGRITRRRNVTSQEGRGYKKTIKGEEEELDRNELNEIKFNWKKRKVIKRS